jgi:methenyltetrahydromethanopterin cyclohydrolase
LSDNPDTLNFISREAWNELVNKPENSTLSLNEGAFQRFDRLMREASTYKIDIRRHSTGATIIDGGIDSIGGIAAGIEVAAICLANRATISVSSGARDIWPGPWINVQSDWPMQACMASQYAGWSLAHEKFFAMGSGPMRAAAAKEALFEHLKIREDARRVVGVLETRKLPPDQIIERIAADCRVAPQDVFLVVAPTASHVGTLQVVARSVETALHKLHELKFDLHCIESAWGTAPLPPIAKNDLAGIGWTNDAVLYGASVSLWVSTDDAQIEAVLEKIPSSASPDYGRPFLEIFDRYHRDFYKIDPLLFSPAQVLIFNRSTGRVFTAGEPRADILTDSFQFKPRS